MNLFLETVFLSLLFYSPGPKPREQYTHNRLGGPTSIKPIFKNPSEVISWAIIVETLFPRWVKIVSTDKTNGHKTTRNT